jgi:predicted transcriptional regulator
MTTTTIRVSLRTRDELQDLARRAGMSMQQVLDQALEQYRRRQILDMTNAAYAALQANPAAWADLHEERAQWDATLSDGLEEV